MVTERDKAVITALARRYGAARVWLFGSSAHGRKRGTDIDLAVEGVAPARFFEFAGKLMLSLSQPVDVLPMGRRSKLGTLIRREGIPIYNYGEPAREG
jgi:predicted nucleotidyltransferase